MEDQGWDESTTKTMADAVGIDELGAMTGTQQVAQSPTRVKAAPSSDVHHSAASRLWWNWDSRCRNKHEVAKQCVKTKRN